MNQLPLLNCEDGLQLMRLGINRLTLLYLRWRRLDAAEQIKVPEILSTHPTVSQCLACLGKFSF